ncbi:hypothetical protein PILCRDRAFT_819898 [Piloderma croceum F 1598]|uniref:Uncharacterized protein n=1 Tax=Piloderma croceum (strain F 1598) TaxID=765440 RepID=A0A0C3FY32_PILCF|nr:hypothetical protein PILCRDRAFT_819898 [Piloderma croceum F 1598]
MQILERHCLFIGKAMVVNLAPAELFAKPESLLLSMMWLRRSVGYPLPVTLERAMESLLNVMYGAIHAVKQPLRL